jgi:superfamily II DNA or RNA helicase
LSLLLQERVKFHVLLTTYEMVSKHLGDIRRLEWAALVVDEAHRLKNASSRLFQVRHAQCTGSICTRVMGLGRVDVPHLLPAVCL